MRISSFTQSNGKRALDIRELDDQAFEFISQCLANLVAARECHDEPEAKRSRT